jgi:hypothetical protein
LQEVTKALSLTRLITTGQFRSHVTKISSFAATSHKSAVLQPRHTNKQMEVAQTDIGKIWYSLLPIPNHFARHMLLGCKQEVVKNMISKC